MRLTFFVIVISLLTAFNTFSQPFDNAISVKGQSSFTVQAIGVRLTVEISEIERNEFQKIREKSIEEVRQDLLIKLGEMGYVKEDLVAQFPTRYTNNRGKTERYRIQVKNRDEVMKIGSFGVKGFKAVEAMFVFPDPIPFDAHEMSKKALEDARNKAEVLAGQANKKVGKIIGINDRTKLPFLSPRNNSSEVFTAVYSIDVTFELLD